MISMTVFKQEANRRFKRNFRYYDEPLVSVDFNTNEHSAIIDGLSTMVIGTKKVKVLAWYDNEWGYSCRVVDLVKYVAQNLTNHHSKNGLIYRFFHQTKFFRGLPFG